MYRALLSILTLLIILPTAAFANTGGGFDVMSLLPIVLIFAVFYFLLLRPQQKKVKAHQELLMTLRRGDKVVTSGGIIGIVQKTTETEVVLEVAENVRINVVKNMINEVITSSAKVASPSADNVTTLPKTIKKFDTSESKSKKTSSKESPLNDPK